MVIQPAFTHSLGYLQMILKGLLFISDSVMWADIFLIQLDRVFQDREHLERPFICSSRTSTVLWLLKNLSAQSNQVTLGKRYQPLEMHMAVSSLSILSNSPGAFQSLVEKTKTKKQLVPLLFQPQEDGLAEILS